MILYNQMRHMVRHIIQFVWYGTFFYSIYIRQHGGGKKD